jgi:hypothetical protein
MSKEPEERLERVRKLLKDAFADVPCPDSFRKANACGPVIHEVCLELRRDFYNYEPEEIHYMLPYVLEDIMYTRTGDDIATRDAEFLVMQLDPLGSDSDIVREVKLKQFADFTQRQALALCEWLRFARTWNDLRLHIDVVDAAIAYWCARGSG